MNHIFRLMLALVSSIVACAQLTAASIGDVLVAADSRQDDSLKSYLNRVLEPFGGAEFSPDSHKLIIELEVAGLLPHAFGDKINAAIIKETNRVANFSFEGNDMPVLSFNKKSIPLSRLVSILETMLPIKFHLTPEKIRIEVVRVLKIKSFPLPKQWTKKVSIGQMLDRYYGFSISPNDILIIHEDIERGEVYCFYEADSEVRLVSLLNELHK